MIKMSNSEATPTKGVRKRDASPSADTECSALKRRHRTMIQKSETKFATQKQLAARNSKSLSAVIPFPSARESIMTLLDTLIDSLNRQRTTVDAAFVQVHGLLVTGDGTKDELPIWYSEFPSCSRFKTSMPDLIDNLHSQTTKTSLPRERWETLVDLHRALLHEHHDFFLACQHPRLSLALRRPTAIYSMPARMWRHDIHSFLESLLAIFQHRGSR